jgi:hypothetical protein
VLSFWRLRLGSALVFELMWQALFLVLCVGIAFLSWPPFFYRRFSRDGYGRPLGRAILWSFGVYVLVGLLADLTFRLPLGNLYAFLLLAAPLPFNAFMFFRGLLYATHKN